VSHMVIFQSPGGSPGYNQFESLEEAVAFVEALRNERNVSSARMFALEEIKFELRPFYKVELQALTTGAPSPAAQPPAPAAAQPPAPAAAQPPAPAAAPAPVAAAPVAPGPAPEPVAPAAPAPTEASTFGAFSASPPADTQAAPVTPPSGEPAADEPAAEPAPARRGLFGR